MYKDVCKRILAIALVMCMVVTLMPQTTMATQAKSYHTYQHGNGSTSGWAEATTAAAIFTVGGAEILDSISFNAHIEEGRSASATVSYYINPQSGNPTSGTYVCAKPINTLTEGFNSVEIGLDRQTLQEGDTFSAVISVKGASLAYCSSAGTGQTYVQENGTWKDAGGLGQSMAIRAYTYNVGDNGEDTRPWLKKVTSLFSEKDSEDTKEQAVNAYLSKSDMMIPVGQYAEIALNGADGTVKWTSKDESVAKVESYGGSASALIWAVKQGETTISANYGGKTYNCSLRVSASLKDAKITVTPDFAVYDGTSHKPVMDVKIGDVTLKENTDYTVSYTFVSADGTEKTDTAASAFVNAGTYHMAFSGIGSYEGTKEIDFVLKPKQITDETIEVILADWNPETPESYIEKVMERDKSLAAGTETDAAGDYYLTCETNQAGEITAVKVVGKGNYEGSRTITTPISIAGAQIVLDESTPFVYQGKEWQPGFQVSLAVNGETVVLPPDSYKAEYVNNINAGTAIIKITGQNGYFGTAEKTFEIAAKDIADAEVSASNVLGNNLPELLAADNGVTLEENKDYRIVSCENNTENGTGECVIEGIGNYKGTRTLSYAVTTRNITAEADSLEIADVIYTGSALTPAVTLMKDGKKVTALTENKDYTITYQNNVNAGDAIVVVQGIGDYAGSLSGTFRIVQADLNGENCIYQFKDASGAVRTAIDYKVDYSGKMEDMKPEVVVTYAGAVLTAGEDYSLEYSIDKADGAKTSAALTVKVSAKDSNYTGERVLTYFVKPCDLGQAEEAGIIKVTLDETKLNYTGEVQKPTLSLTYADGTELKENKDYTVAYLQNDKAADEPKEVGEYTVRITGINNYSGTIEKEFKISSVDIGTIDSITADKTHGNHVADYDGTWFAMMWFDDKSADNNKLKLTIKNGRQTLVENTDYTLSYENTRQVSDSTTFAKVKITGKGMYTGEREIYYLLAGRLNDYKLSLKEEKLVYTGENLTLKDESISLETGRLFWKEVLTLNTDYRVSYEDNRKAGEATIYIEAVEDNELPTEHGCYRYDNKDVKLSDKFTISPKDIGASDVTQESEIEKEYTQTAVTLESDEISLVYNGVKLLKDDFKMDAADYSDNAAPGEAAVTITGTGNFTGTRQISFVIKGKSLEGAVAETEKAVYTGEALYPEITKLTIDGETLTEGRDYTYEASNYEDNINAGTGKLVVLGCGEYTGSTVELPFTIEKCDISDGEAGTCDIEGVDSAYTYTSEEITPEAEVYYQRKGLEKEKLISGTDYTISYRDNTDCTTTAAVVVEGVGNYTGKLEWNFAIWPKDITADEVVIAEIPAQEYNNGLAVQPVPEIIYKYGKSDAAAYCLTPEDYTLTYESNNNVGTATVTIEGKDNFKGKKDISFHIGESIKDQITIQVKGKTEFVYTGSAYKPEVAVVNNETGEELKNGTDYEVSYGENINAGTGTIKVTGIGKYAGEKVHTFEIQPKNLADGDVELAVEGVTDGEYKTSYTGSPVTPKVTVTYNGNIVTDYDVSYGTNNIDVGEVNIIVTAKEGGNFTGTIQEVAAAKFTITKASIGTGGEETSSGFFLEEIEPQALLEEGYAEPEPQLYHRGKELEEGTDFTYFYEENDADGTDTAVVLKGTGNYTGSVRRAFRIRKEITEGTVKITMPESVAYKDYVKEGKPSSEIILTGEDEPVLTIDGYTLAKGVDYEVSYCNNTWIGTAEVIFKGIGAYTGTVKKTFKITANLADETDAAKIVIGDQKHTGSAVKVKPIVTYYGTALKEGTHFTVAGYENNTEITKETEATVKISGNEENGFTGTCTATFKIAADTKALQISGMEESYFYRGESITPEVVVKSGEATLAASEYEVVYGENLHVGTGTIAVVGKGKYAGCANMVEFQILPLKMETLTVTGADAKPLTDKEYTGQPILPEILLEAEIGSKKYKLPTGDYSVSVKDSGDNTNVGIVTLEIKGGTNITGSRDVTFNIVPKSLAKPETGKDNISVKVTWDDGYVYDGTAKTPDVVVTYQYGDGETEISTLTKDTDYTLTYSDNTSAGTAKVIVTGKENYTGSRTETFTIKQQDFSDVAIVNLPGGTSYVYMGTKVEPKVSVSANGVTLTQDTDYVLSYENNTTCGTATVTVTGKGNFSGTIKGNFTIVEHNIATSSDIKIGNDGKIPNQGYTGAPIVPNISISCGSYKLKAGVDYELSCSDNTDMGTATIIIKGIGGFTGSKELKFNIKTNIAKVLVEGLKDTYSYTGKQLTEADLAISKVTLGATPLNKDTDYTISFADDCDATNVGKHTVIVNGVGEYGGTAEFPVTITPKNIQDDDVELQGFSENPPYTGLVTTQNISLYWRGKDITLLKDKDYEVVYTPSGELGNFVMTITGKGNYVGTIEKKYRVETVPVDSLEINDISSVYTYTGAEIVPEPTLLHDSYKLKKNVDYTLTYSDNTEVGTAKVTITGIGACCTGTKDITFKIVQKSINKLQAGTIAAQIYTGKDIVPGVTLTDEKKILAENTDYTLLYKKNRKTGTGSVVITGKGNYTSTRTIPFAIRPSGVESMMVTGASQTTASLSWKSEGAVTGFEIYRKTAGGKWQLVGGTGESTYTDTKLSSGTTYIYKLRSYVIEEEQTYYGEFSPEFVGTTME